VFERTLADFEWVLGTARPNSRTFRGNLADAYDSAGRPTPK
jgi:hypothetical protein